MAGQVDDSQGAKPFLLQAGTTLAASLIGQTADRVLVSYSGREKAASEGGLSDLA